MRVRMTFIALIAAILAISAFCVCALLTQSWLFSKHVHIDINSGDIRWQVRLCSLKITDRIDESLLSQEARRLEIDVPTGRVWKSVGTRYIAGSGSGSYGITMGLGDALVQSMIAANTPDPERRVIIERFLSTLRTKTPHEVYARFIGLAEDVRE